MNSLGFPFINENSPFSLRATSSQLGKVTLSAVRIFPITRHAVPRSWDPIAWSVSKLERDN
ncbi:MAG: hypothetical protein Q3959_03495 [Limosilactobacillus sp.]|uniref:hypothetical protein n=1 Tax=Limosilactobacillus sp. TaxID=2773925 RepID=UPI0027049055|nr:hypothetical protein [Limosilactobacillus sp.]